MPLFGKIHKNHEGSCLRSQMSKGEPEEDVAGCRSGWYRAFLAQPKFCRSNGWTVHTRNSSTACPASRRLTVPWELGRIRRGEPGKSALCGSLEVGLDVSSMLWRSQCMAYRHCCFHSLCVCLLLRRDEEHGGSSRLKRAEDRCLSSWSSSDDKPYIGGSIRQNECPSGTKENNA